MEDSDGIHVITQEWLWEYLPRSKTGGLGPRQREILGLSGSFRLSDLIGRTITKDQARGFEKASGKVTAQARRNDGPIVFLHFDGACQSNPGGECRWAFRAKDPSGRLLLQDWGILPAGVPQTNNSAEWQALLEGLKALQKHSARWGKAIVKGDSMLVVEQASGRWRVKQEHLAHLSNQANGLIKEIGPDRIVFQWIRRDLNAECDSLMRPTGFALRSQESLWDNESLRAAS